MEVASIYQMLDFRDHDFMSRAKEQLELADRLGVKRILPCRASGADEAKALHSVSADYDAVGQFMEQNLCIQTMKAALTELVQYAKALGG